MKRTLKKALSVLLAVTMVFGIAPLSGFVGLKLPEFGGFEKFADSVSNFFDGFATKAEAATSGMCGENLSYVLDIQTGILTISGTGDMANYNLTSHAPWYGNRSYIKSVSIGNGVTSIGVLAFYRCVNLININIPNSVISIGDEAFYDCNSLTSITIPDSVTSIGGYTFYRCTNLSNVSFPNKVTNIGRGLFKESGIYNDEKNWENDVIYFGYYLIEAKNTMTGSYSIKEETKLIAEGAFSSCTSLTSITIPNSVTNIDEGVFGGCTALTSITFPNSVTSIGEGAFGACHSLTSVEIPDSVTSIGDSAFYNCDSLTSVIIPGSVTSIGDSAFEYCNSLTSVTIPDSVTIIGNRAFLSCHSLTSVEIGDSVESIGDYAFFNSGIVSVNIPCSVTNIGYNAFRCPKLTSVFIDNGITNISDHLFNNCDSLTSITIPNSVTSIGVGAFYDCDNLTNITIPDSVTSIGRAAFYDDSITGFALTDVYYTGTENEWNAISIGDNNNALLNATIHYNHKTEDEQPSIQTQEVNIAEDIVFLDIGEQYQFTASDKNGTDITNKAYWNDTTSVECKGEIELVNPGEVKAVHEGLASVMTSYHHEETKELIGFDSCYVFVGNPNEIKYHSISDTIYYYGENAFYSDACQFSDSADIYISLKNAIKDEIEFLTKNDKCNDEFETLTVNGYTLTASVSGSNLSFDKNEYINKYTSAIGADIPIDKAVDELLTLYPYNLDVSSGDKSFTVTVEIKSEDFDTITDSFTFKISSLEDKEINEHISFIDTNGAYRAMRDADFASGMSELKNDAQYIWSKYSTLDFENYYEILMADVLVQLMGTQLVGNISLLPVLKEWQSNYNKILDGVSTIVEDSYTGYMEITDNLIDKVIKKSKYTTDGMAVHDEVRDLVVMKLREKVSIDKINSAFAAIDKTGQCLDLFDLSVNITNDIADWIDCVSIMNSYQNMNEEFKNVIKKVYDCIPSDDWKVKDAVEHYVNLDTSAGYTQEVIESVIELSKDITLEVFNSIFKKQIISIFTKAVGSITLKSGALLSSTTAFSTISTGLGAVATGASLGLCISDILCNNSGQAEEMSKVVVASELAPYVIQTMKYYEWALKNYKDESSLKHFETAFKLNKVLQNYSIDHTYKGLEIQANSLVIQWFSNRDYPGAMAELASLKTAHVNCNCCEDVYTGVIKTKTIAVKCPVDVYVYDKNGKEVVRIINDVAEFVENGINVFINGREKYITVPADQEYSVKIVATDNGTMDYLVIEHDENSRYKRIVNNLNIDLTKNQVFTGNVCKEFDVNMDCYELKTDVGIIPPSDSVDVSHDEKPTEPTTKPTEPTTKPTEPSTKPVTPPVTEVKATVEIRKPSQTKIKYGDSIILHADVENLPEGAYIEWSADNGNFTYTASADGSTCTVSPSASGDTTFTAIVYDKDGNEIGSYSQTMTAKAGFFQKLIAFFKNIFGLTKVIPEAFKGIL